MSDVALVAGSLLVVILVQAWIIRALLAGLKSMTNAVVADDAHELRMLEAVPPRPALHIPFIGPKQAEYDEDEDDDSILPAGLSG